jgi:hypothetical protein
MQKMRVFAGKARGPMWQGSHSRLVYPPQPIPAMIEQ